MKGLGSNFFRRLLASYFAVLLVTSTIAFVLLDRSIDHDGEAAREALSEDCLMLAPLAERIFRGELEAEGIQDYFAGLGARTGARVTLIAPDGAVILDSHEEPARMAPHGDRPEVLQSYREEFGVARRPSQTVGYSMLYVAHLLREGDEPLGVIRLSFSLEAIERDLASGRNVVLLGTGAGLLVALVLSLFMARRFTAPIAAVTSVAEDLRAGRYGSRVTEVTEGELGVLAEAMNRMGAELTARIARMTQEDARMRAMLAAMVEGIVAVDEEGRIAFCNAAARRLLGLGDAELVGRRWWEVLRVSGLVEILEKANEARSLQTGELVLGMPPAEAYVNVHAAPFAAPPRQEGEAGDAAESPPGLVVVLNDISELRRLERVRRDFVANVSHELKTPLASIKGFVETLLAGALEDEAVNERFLARIGENVQRLNHLVSDLLSLARIEAAAGTVPRVPVGMNELVGRVAESHATAAEDKGLELVVEPGESQQVFGDPEALEQIVGNLLSNAIHYTSEGRVSVRLRNAGRRGLLEVEDTGEGIPREDLDRVFERFYRVDKARSRSVGGTGLGLSIVRNLTHAMEGQVRVESVLGEGSTFTVDLELASSGV